MRTLALRAGVTENTIRRANRGEKVSDLTIGRLASALDVPYDVLATELRSQQTDAAPAA